MLRDVTVLSDLIHLVSLCVCVCVCFGLVSDKANQITLSTHLINDKYSYCIY